MKVVLVDFYDSFTFNIKHYLDTLDVDVHVVKDDDVILKEIGEFDSIILSPGPGLPKETKSLFPILKNYYKSHKILGVCLGMQGIAQFFDAEIYNLDRVYHGKMRTVAINNNSWLFSDLNNEMNVVLYHSWAVRLKKNDVLKITAQTEDDLVMAFEHESLNICGVQFHPESILTANGIEVFKNFLFNNRERKT